MGRHANQARELRFHHDRCYTTRRDTIAPCIAKSRWYTHEE